MPFLLCTLALGLVALSPQAAEPTKQPQPGKVVAPATPVVPPAPVRGQAVPGEGPKRAEDLRVRDIRVISVSYYNAALMDAPVETVDIEVTIENYGTQVFGHRISLFVELMRGRHDLGLKANNQRYALAQVGGIPSGLRPGALVRQRVRVHMPGGFPDTGRGQWQTVWAVTGGGNDQRRDNDSMLYSFVMDAQGRLAAEQRVYRRPDNRQWDAYSTQEPRRR